MKSAILFVILLVDISISIYTPGDLIAKPPTVTRPIWRKMALKSYEIHPEIIMHHNYSRVTVVKGETSQRQPKSSNPKIEPFNIALTSDDLPKDNASQKNVFITEMLHSGETVTAESSNHPKDYEFAEQVGPEQKFDRLSATHEETGKNLDPVKEFEVFGFHYPPRPEEVYPFKKPYANMAFEKCPKMVTGQLVFHWSCSQFLNCWKGRGQIQNCGPGTLFNPATLECDYPEKVNCISGTHNQKVRQQKEIKDVRDCPKGFSGFIPHSSDCAKFVHCNHGVAYEMDCGPGTVYNHKIYSCDHPSKVPECEVQDGVTEYFQTQPHQVPLKTEASDVYNQRCSQTGQCKDIKQNMDRSYASSNVKGHFIKVEEPKPEKLVIDQRPRCPSGHSGLLPHPTNCAKFLNCANGISYIQDCGAGTVFNPTTSVCDWPYNVKCGSTSDETIDGTTENIIGDDTISIGRTEVTGNVKPGWYHGQWQGINTQTGQRETQQTYQSGLGHQTGIPNYRPIGQNHYVGRQPELQPQPGHKTLEQSSHGYHQAGFGYQTAKGQPGRPPIPPQTGYVHQTTSEQSFPHGIPTGYPQSGHGHTASGQSQLQGRPPVNHQQVGYGQQPGHYQIEFEYQTPTDTQGRPHKPVTEQGFIHGQKTEFGHEASGGSYQYGNIPQYNTGTVYRQPHHSGSSQTQQPNSGSQHIGWQIPQKTNGQIPSWQHTNTNTQHTRPLTEQTKHQSEFEPQNTNTKPFGLQPAGSEQHYNKQPGFSQHVPETNPPRPVYRPHVGNQPIPSQIPLQPYPTQANRPICDPMIIPKQFVRNGLETENSDQVRYGWNVHKQPCDSSTKIEVTVTTTKNNNMNVPGGRICNGSVLPEEFVRSGGNKQEPCNEKSTQFDHSNRQIDAEDVTQSNIHRKPVPWKSNKFCTDKEFECSSTECIPLSWVCDGSTDCKSGLDEADCQTGLKAFKKNPNVKLKAQEIEKWLQTDLDTCANYCLKSASFQCKSFNFRRSDAICLLCDTNVGLSGGLEPTPQYDYYELEEFTVNCSQMHECPNKKCIETEMVCDGNDDCGDRSDEKFCSREKLGYEIRLAGSKKQHAGRIEVKVFGEWGFVCDDQFGLRDADVVCAEMGYHLGALEVKAASFFATEIKENETFYLMDDVACLGNETSLKDCNFAGWGTHNCLPQEIVGVICKTPEDKCKVEEWKCDTTNECIPLDFLCDAVPDCSDKSDEGSQHCDAPIEIRLANGTSKQEGRVEIRYHGIWGTICDDDFNDRAAQVICRSMGYLGSSIAKKDATFGQGSGPIWLDQVNCLGNETGIENCKHFDWKEHNCEHTEDVGVICSTLTQTGYEKKSRDPITEEISKATSYEDVLNSVKCGQRNEETAEDDRIHFRVVSGSVAKKGHYPWQATIRIRAKSKSFHWCGAVVISNKFILTAAHCLVGFTKETYFVSAGDYDVDIPEGTEQEAYIEDYFTHERFRQDGHMNNDLAIIKLKGAGFRFTKHVQPICLPEKHARYHPGMNCTISGFGSTQTGKSTSSRVMRAGWIPILSQDTCKSPVVYGSEITDGMFCAGSLDEGIDACDGDSGGPLACVEKDLFTLYGITSWGQHCGYANKPGVYVRVSHYRDWINRVIEENY